MHPLSIAIAGCGPAGLAAALFLHRAGHAVTLVDRFENPKPLGSGLMLQPTGLAVLAALGLDQPVLKRGARLARLYGRTTPSNRRVLDVRFSAYGGHAFGLGVHRATLFGELYDAVLAAGIPLQTGFEVAGLAPETGNRHWVMAGDGARLGPFDLVIDALGSRSPLPEALFGRRFIRPLAYGALWTTLPWPVDGPFVADQLEQRYQRASVMVGVLPTGSRTGDRAAECALFWSLKPDTYDDWRRAGLAAWKQRVLTIWPQTAGLLDAITEPEQMVLARYGHHTLPRPCLPGVAFIGDCAHSASPQLGQGANMALLDALALSLAIDASTDLPAGLAAYARMRRRHVFTYQTMSRLFTPVYQSDSRILPLLRDWLVAPLTRIPLAQRLLATMVVGTLVEPIAGRGPITIDETGSRFAAIRR